MTRARQVLPSREHKGVPCAPAARARQVRPCAPGARVRRVLPCAPAAASLLLLLGLLLVGPALAITKLCLEKLTDTSTIYFHEHPARSLAVLASQAGMLTLVSLPPLGTTTMARRNTWLDLTGRVQPGGEMGLLSFAFHPNFLSNGRFFVSYICDSTTFADCQFPCGCDTSSECPGASCTASTIIAEYTTDGSPATATSVSPTEKIILGFGRPFFNHNGGQIFFGKDGYLYIASGDGGGVQGDPLNLTQNPANFIGKLLRINVDQTSGGANYAIPPDNPFQGPGQNPLTYAIGLRNPWRCDQDPASGSIACGDVGWDHTEEINIISRGGNYMWPNYEGTYYMKGSKASQLLGVPKTPFYQYNHTKSIDCIIGGVFVSNSAVNGCLKGKYIYSDLNGPMWYLSTQKAGNKPQSVTPCVKNERSCSNIQLSGIFSWGRDISGNAYVMGPFGLYRVARQGPCGIFC